MTPLVSVVIVNRNGMDFVDTCLRSVLNNNYPNFEVIFVDNASSDGSLEYAQNNFGRDRRMRFVRNNASVGPAVGRNSGAKSAKGKYLVFLDNDTKVDQDWIIKLAEIFENDNSIGAAQSKLLRMDTNLYDCAGDYLGPLGFLIERSRGAEDKGQFDYVADILSAKSAASIIRKDIFDKIGGFDEDFYMYLEETDLSWRVWLFGYRVVFIPDSVVYHAFNTPKKDMKKYYSKYLVRFYGCRNYITTLIKNLEMKSLVKILPLHIIGWMAIAFLFLLKGAVKDCYYIIKGILWNFLNLDVLANKRKGIKDLRIAGDKDIFKKIKSKESINSCIRKICLYLHIGLK